VDPSPHTNPVVGEGEVPALPGVEAMTTPQEMTEKALDKAYVQVEDAEHVIAVMVDNLGQSVNTETSDAYLKYVQQYGIPVTKEEGEHGTTTNSQGAREA
jgi:hypothetical protein